MSAKAQRFEQLEVPKQAREVARLKVVQGVDYGCTYVLFSTSVTLGRGEESDIVLRDSKASRNHAEFRKEDGRWKVLDSGSANGVRVNGQPVEEAFLSSGDSVAVGETLLEFMTSAASTKLLVAPPKDLDRLKARAEGAKLQKNRIEALITPAGGKDLKNLLARKNGGVSRPAPNRKMVLYVVLGLVAAWTFLDDDKATKLPSNGSAPTATKPPAAVARNLAQYLPNAGKNENTVEAKRFFQTGFRDYREKNYLRARTAFETALQIDPSLGMARIYLANCEKAIADEVTYHLEMGRKRMDSGRLKEARGHYETVLRLMFRQADAKEAVEAKGRLGDIQKIIQEAGG